MCIDFEMLKVKVPTIFSVTQGFPARRDRRYIRFNWLGVALNYCLALIYCVDQATLLLCSTIVNIANNRLVLTA